MKLRVALLEVQLKFLSGNLVYNPEHSQCHSFAIQTLVADLSWTSCNGLGKPLRKE